jgi:hypothetical protein
MDENDVKEFRKIEKEWSQRRMWNNILLVLNTAAFITWYNQPTVFSSLIIHAVCFFTLLNAYCLYKINKRLDAAYDRITKEAA